MNPHEDLARWKKASAIADTIERLVRATLREFCGTSPKHWGILLKHAEKLDDAQWRQFALIAGQRPPSEATQRVVLEILRGRGQCAGVDPFAGVSQ